MRIPGIAAVAAALLFAGTAVAEDRTCSGRGAGEAGTRDFVTVDFVVSDAGEIRSRKASWTPPATRGGMADLTAGAPILVVNYRAPTAEGLGAPFNFTAFSMFFTRNAGFFDGALMVFAAGDRTWASQPMPRVTGNDDQGKTLMTMGSGIFEAALQPDLFAGLDSMGSVELAMRRGRKVLKTSTYDLSNRARRDAQFAQAWVAATEAAKTPAACKAADK